MASINSTSLSWDDIMDMVILVDERGTILSANKRFYDTTGVSEKQEHTNLLSHLAHPSDVFEVKHHLLGELIRGNDVRSFEFRIADRKKSVIDVECSAKTVFREDCIVGYLLIIRDITGRKIMERDHAKAITILGLAKLAEFRDEDTGTHLERIREYSRMLAKELCRHPKYKGYIKPNYVEDLFQSSTLHDIGKVGISDTILLKPGKLTGEEFAHIKMHTSLGGDVLSNIDSQIESQSFLTLGKQIAYYHHEKWDGSGYTAGLKGEGIPLSARIVALADVYDALTSKRPYKKAFTHEKAYSIIVSEKGNHFDPDIVDAFIAHSKEFNKIHTRIQE